jgi:hypothetical protein
MLGVTQIDEKKVLKPIDEMLADPWQVDIQELFEASVNEPDEIKKNLYDSHILIFYKKDKKRLLIVLALLFSPLKAC